MFPPCRHYAILSSHYHRIIDSVVISGLVTPMRRILSILAAIRHHPVRSLVFAFAIVFFVGLGRFAFWPPVGLLVTENPGKTAFMEHRQTQWQSKGKKLEVKQTWKNLAHISPHLQKAVVTSEDSTFWDHAGFDLTGMREAMKRNISRGKLSAGGSTITQQLAKNLYFSPEKSLVRKAREAIVVTRLEAQLSKDRILELYLNCVEWGDGIFGAESAARHYFNTSAAKLTQRQAATLAAMLPAPLTRSPTSPIVRKHASTILARMRSLG